jgi:16S rRNA (cytosine967-C5)-methyltransferase
MNVAPARALATEVLLQVAEGMPATAALEAGFARTHLEDRDRGLVTQLVDGTLRWRGRLDHLLQQCADRPLAELAPAVLETLRMAAFQLMMLERIPAHAAVHDAVELARKYAHEGAGKLANAVLRRLEREQASLTYPDPTEDPVGYLATYYSHPAWLVARWLSRFGFEETAALLQAHNVPPQVTLRTNKRWITRDALHMFLQMHGLETTPTLISPQGLLVDSGGNPRVMEEYREGLFSIQGEASMIAVEVLHPGRGKTGWDLAAGVGGKTTYLAEFTGDTGHILATDTSEDRLAVLRTELERLELQAVEVQAVDARTAPVEAASRDYALLDAPCSGTGSLRRQADARWRKTPEQIAALTVLQGELLAAAARAVKPGGFLVYSTCSLEPEENAEVVRAFLEAHPAWQRESAAAHHRTLPADAVDDEGFVQLFPHRHNTDGFFIARLACQQA